jgi:hypothetical protein
MKFVWLAVAFVAACDFAGASGTPLEVDAGIDAAIAPTDPDGDGLFGDADNCPSTANLAQLDYDGDGRGDLCDPCPHLAPAAGSSAISDRDGDGVGDACDPNPDTPTDRIAWFDDFDDPATFEHYSVTAGIWTIADGYATQTPGLHLIGFMLFSEELVRPAVSTGIIVDELGTTAYFGTTAFNPVFGTITSYAGEASGSIRGQGCTLRWDDSTIIANRAGSTAIAAVGSAWPAMINVGERYEMRHTIREANHCAASGPAGATGADDEQPGLASGFAGLAFSRMRVRYDYLFIVDQAALP